MKKYILALDQGTTSSRALLLDKEGHISGVSQKEFKQIYPQKSWVEHDPEEIFESQLSVLNQVLDRGITPQEIDAVGITNQRETTILWNKNTGKPVYNAIVWQCRRTMHICNRLKAEGHESLIRSNTGLLPDAYFSGTKIMWILENVPGVREEAEKGNILFGTVDTWLMWKLSGGKIHKTDYSNASRTLLFNIHELKWDEKILKIMNIPPSILPEISSTSGLFGYTDEKLTGKALPITGVAGDQQAALFGQLCFHKGDVKNTYGTGCFMLMNTGKEPVLSDKGLLTSVAWSINGETTYALEGSVFMAGAVIQWLRDELRLISDASETEAIAGSVPDTRSVYLVSSFQGIGSPYWNMEATGMITGLTRGAGKAHIVRAALESIAYRTRDILTVMEEESGLDLKKILVDGGASRNNFLMQFQSDILNTRVIRPSNVESTALGAAYLAGLASGFWKDRSELSSLTLCDREFIPVMEEEAREKLYRGWTAAVKQCLNQEL